MQNRFRQKRYSEQNNKLAKPISRSIACISLIIFISGCSTVRKTEQFRLAEPIKADEVLSKVELAFRNSCKSGDGQIIVRSGGQEDSVSFESIKDRNTWKIAVSIPFSSEQLLKIQESEQGTKLSGAFWLRIQESLKNNSLILNNLKKLFSQVSPLFFYPQNISNSCRLSSQSGILNRLECKSYLINYIHKGMLELSFHVGDFINTARLVRFSDKQRFETIEFLMKNSQNKPIASLSIVFDTCSLN